MPSLRDFRDRIKSVKSTKKITSAMKMVAASKLRRAQDQAEASQPYARAMADMLARVASNINLTDVSARLLTGTGSDRKHLLIVVSADRGLCGGFNTNIFKAARKYALGLQDQGKDVYLVTIGRKGYELLRKSFAEQIWKNYSGFTGKKRVEYADAHKVTELILQKFEDEQFDICTLIYNEFKSVLIQRPRAQQLIPFKLPEVQDNKGVNGIKERAESKAKHTKEDAKAELVSPYAFEPSEEKILNELLPKNIGVQVFRALLDSAAGEQAARMTAMDNATRNAGDMIDGLTLEYNRARQAYITNELIEIISGAEAL